MDPIVLLRDIASQKYTAVKVIGAYLRAAVLAHRVVNCVTEFLPALAFARATFLDEHLARTGTVLGPLHGLPVSLKDMIDMKGFSNNYAISFRVDTISEEDSALVSILRDKGAVFYQRTTQPQFLMHIECHSNIYGTTSNPYNTLLTCGGSSGGEAASMAFGASCVGIGTDIGGSIRGPAALQGLYGLKPTSGRLPILDCYNPMAGAESITFVSGPIGRTLAVTELVTKTIVDSRPWKVRPELNRIPWETQALSGKSAIKVGILRHDGTVTPQPPIQRAMQEVVAKLQTNSIHDEIEIQLVEFTPYKHEESAEIISNLYFEDGGAADLKLLEGDGEPLTEMSKDLFDDGPDPKPLSIAQLWAFNKAKHTYRKKYNDHWQASGIDVLICPTTPGPAQPHNTSFYARYTSQWNLLDYPAITFPITAVDQQLDVQDPNYKPKNELDEDYYTRYSPETYADAPVALQLVAQRNEDEFLLATLKLIEACLAK